MLDSTLWDKVCQLLAAVRWFSPGTPVSSTNKTDHHDITEILLKVALNDIAITTTLHASGVECINTTTHEIVGPCTCINMTTHS